MDAEHPPFFAIRPSPVVILFALATGVLIADTCASAAIPVAVIVACATGLSVFLNRDSSGSICTALIFTVMVLVSIGWAHTRFGPHESTDSPDSRLVCLEGRVIGPVTQPLTRSRGSIARFMMVRPSARFGLEVQHATTEWASERRVPWAGRVEVVLCDDGAPFPRPASRVRVLGRWLTPSPPRNPGERDAVVAARRGGIVGRVIVDSSAQIDIIAHASERRHILDHARSAIEALRAHARRVIPPAASLECQSLLAALLLGTREAEFPEVYASFRRIGLAHVLAISGMHLVIVVGGGVGLARLLTPDPRIEWIVTATLLGLYVALVPARVPISRAAMMIGIWLVTQVAGARLRGIDIWAIAGVVILVIHPDELFMPGFQLSFGVVAAMILLTHRLERTLFVRWSQRGLANPYANRGWLRRWMETSAAASLVAWLASTPLAAFHFGIITPLAAPLSVACGPLVSILLILGYLRGVMAHLHATAVVQLIDPVLLYAAQLWLSAAEQVGRLPFALLHVPSPHFAWVVSSMTSLFVVVLLPVRSSRRHRVLWLLVAMIAIMPLCPSNLQPANLLQRSPALRLTMFDVGDGSAYLIQPAGAGHNAIMVDAGSRGDASVGDRVLVPALRASGVRRLRTLIVTHADIDHYSGAIAVMREMRPRTLVVTPQIVMQWTTEPDGPLALLRATAIRYGIDIRARACGDQLDVNRRIQLTWLHPAPESDLGSDNNNSSVIRIDVETDGPDRRILFTGDIEASAIRAILSSTDPEDLRADILELPHHGSWSANAIRLVRMISPQVILQSTGRSRMATDRWQRVVDSLGDTRRHVTSRDGAVTLTISSGGEIRTEAFVSLDYASEK